MAAYSQQAERIAKLQRLPAQVAPPQGTSPTLQQEARGKLQAEYHRPPELVKALVQRHFFPAEGTVADGVGEPVPETGSSPGVRSGGSPNEYQQLVRRRAAQTSKAIRAEQDAKLQLVQAARDRVRAGREYGDRVALGRLQPGQAKEGAAEEQEQAVTTEEVPSGAPAAPTSLSPQPAVQEQRPAPEPQQVKVVLVVSPSRERGRRAGLSHEQRQSTPRQGAAGGDSSQAAFPPAQVQQPPAPPLPPPPSVAARHRLLSHCPAAAAAGAGAAGTGWASLRVAGQGAATAAARAGAVPSTPGHLAALDLGAPSPAAEYRTRVLQPCNTNRDSPPNAKLFKGRPLPTAVSVSDTMGLARIAQRVAQMGDKVSLPRLCSCPNRTSPFDPKYVTHCARNCPLYGQPARYEQLLTGLLRASDVI